ncbi:peptide chain release factor N(5)-glutamine methyltransferase [Lactobacillus sp. LC28-10]|uniref:Release factor glutamine methyltransferase n=1 Tax=Secundilactobacillus angelensis TaxID=2722706 RepID=A0ABX1KWV7_9LACO|nr:peptide chain release factor N(5)-glutamine methyltransferase [Secundilactobacillus angelensis]MCH5462112.1 peptide chain release factor N(5)-glutamine methyltransferase [Secundilactobacillus angelensis]NLR18407.1 peptide chain release factor N(5)-glutamine methyltransferase [Secundilactobacillus angelensis]
MSNRTYYEALKWASLFVQKNHLDESAATFLLQELSHLDQTHLLIKYRQPIPADLDSQYVDAINQYVNGMPPQYIVGTAEFYGERFAVNQSVLIPRQETEELVEWVLTDEPQSQLSVLDVGTGSGAIGITLKKQRPNWQVTLTDLSAAALAVAEENAAQLNVSVTTVQGDLLEPVAGSQFDVIVSNPPYISHAEESEMDADVLASEPTLALFADHDGLAIYERLADQLEQGLVTTNQLYLEIGFRQGKAVRQIFQQRFPNAAITMRQDMSGHDRMVQIRF